MVNILYVLFDFDFKSREELAGRVNLLRNTDLSGFTHVAVVLRAVPNVSGNVIHDPLIEDLVSIIRQGRRTLIWGRWLWNNVNDPLYTNAHNQASYYANVLRTVLTEAEAFRDLGLQVETLLDVEPYGDSPQKAVEFSIDDAARAVMEAAQAEAVNQIGQVDYMLPGDSTNVNHISWGCNNLARLRITEFTYYSVPPNYTTSPPTITPPTGETWLLHIWATYVREKAGIQVFPGKFASSIQEYRLWNQANAQATYGHGEIIGHMAYVEYDDQPKVFPSFG